MKNTIHIEKNLACTLPTHTVLPKDGACITMYSNKQETNQKFLNRIKWLQSFYYEMLRKKKSCSTL